MTFSRRKFFIGSGIVLWDLSLQSPASATSAVSLTLPELRARSSRIVLGRPVLHESKWVDIRGSQRIVTSTRFVQVRDWLQGSTIDDPVEDEFMIWTLGGQVGDIGQKVPGEAALPLDEEVLLFIGDGNEDHQRVIGMSQGAYPLAQANDGPMLTRSRHLPHLLGRSRDKDAPELSRPAVDLLHEARLSRAFSLIRKVR